MFVLRVCGTLAVALTSIFITTSAFACDQRFPWTCPASFDPPAVGVPVGDKEEGAAIKRVPKIAAPAAADAQPARSTAKRPGTTKAGPGAAARNETTPARTKPTVVMVPEPVAPRPRPGPRDTFAERAWLPITTQDVANEIDLAAPAPVVVTTVPVSKPAPQPVAAAETPAPEKSTQGSAVVEPRAAPVPSAVSAPEVVMEHSVSTRKEPAEEDMSWLRKIFIGLGSLLAVASAFRMAIG